MFSTEVIFFLYKSFVVLTFTCLLTDMFFCVWLLFSRIIDGDEETQIHMLHDYRLELMRTHPGSTIIIDCSEEGVFQGMYVCLAPLRAGFLAGCRKIVSLDGCWLKGLYGGQLLSAVGIDGNDCIYPIAWSMVNRETKESWTKFLQVLKQDLRITDSQDWAFMSDRQKVRNILLLNLCVSICFDVN